MKTLLNNLKIRAQAMKAMRRFFDDAGFCEVETATALREIAPEEFIEAISTDNGRFLRSSPELLMKELLCAGMAAIYQLGPCFRAGEYGSRHREEFSLLEYYHAGWDYRKLADFTAKMLYAIAMSATGHAVIPFRDEELDFAAEPEIITVEGAFQRYAQCSCAEAVAANQFDELMVTKIEPELGRGHLTFLCDYPADRASLARLKPDDPRYAERWEVYGCGMELGNAFGELTDAAQQKARFAEANAFRASQKMKAYPETEEFFAALEHGLPESSGCAIGFDRICMLLCNAPDIGLVRADLLSFPAEKESRQRKGGGLL